MYNFFLKYRRVLYPFSFLYAAIVVVRNWLFDVGILKSESFKTPTISIGNIAVGGTGKTPHVEYLIELLSPTMKIAVLSRGYKRKTKGYILLDDNSIAEQVGDEPKQMKENYPNITIAVDENRRHGIQQLEATVRPDIILLDDAFQHRYVKPNISILLTDYAHPFWEDSYLPAGNLRDSKSQIYRAEIIIVSKSPENLTPIIQRTVYKNLNLFPYQRFYFTRYEYRGLKSLGKKVDIKNKKDYTVLLFSGIARNEHLYNYLKEEYKHVELINFPDHHHFTVKDIEKIIEKFEEIYNENKIIVTTQKDAVKLKDNTNFAALFENPVFYQKIKTVFFNENDEKEFKKIILKHVERSSIIY